MLLPRPITSTARLHLVEHRALSESAGAVVGVHLSGWAKPTLQPPSRGPQQWHSRGRTHTCSVAWKN